MIDSAQVRLERLQQARQLMKQHGVDALIIPSADPHMSEYLPEYWQGRSWLSGFTGSMGTLVVLQDFAGLWTDSRYWVQAPMQLAGTGIELKKIQVDPTYAVFLAEHLPQGAKVAIDGNVLSVSAAKELQAAFADKNITLVTDIDILAQIWHDRPSLPMQPIYQHPDKFVDTSITDKLAKVRQVMAEKGVSHHLVCSLDDIAWILNLRGSDVEFNPVFLSHLLIDEQKATLFVHQDKLSDVIIDTLTQAGVGVADYDAAAAALAEVSGVLLIDPSRVAVGTLTLNSAQLVHGINPSTLLKSIKSEADIAHIREAMRQDGAALCEFFAEFEKKLAAGETITELDIDTMLNQARSRQPDHVSASFNTIAGFNANGAIVHYSATVDNHSVIEGDGLLLIDSGGQYYNGTTDITRVAGVGQVSHEQKQDVTYVLKAHIGLAQAYFPENLPSAHIDALARIHLWSRGLDYRHGTGHGVGYFMNVHEDPQVISVLAQQTPERVLKRGMVTTNEPGLYREGKWGIRLENCVVHTVAYENEFGVFLKFDDLTLCPFDTRLILPELLTEAEKHWLNAYHQRVHDELIDRVDGDAKQWLIERTKPV
ncbi:Xaa-Pro aminopeptidase [Moraxella cuniculi DSM 21768]|uniref:Xaa-Pro aminopeptidase n=1 Tax=Moraxella cuniculi DSM 21768 TaxID=1122245 RepID=A0A1N7E5C0_9GAMM|nr:aminopeptidase P family protein [Moraxella cuniculi]OOS06636.1 Xaa-Pro aminopeptidase [Moraxella cuniculi]SIR83251.1 Xaa-Pro aminopeptidase [Moraxella cuniculi DSM 21768]